MKHRGWMVGAVSMVAAAGLAFAQPENTKPGPKPAPVKPIDGNAKPTQPAKDGKNTGAADPAMEMMMQMGAPGEHHKHLAALVGDWSAVTKFRMAPDQPWNESKGTMKSRLEWGGRFLVSDFQGDMGGQSFTGQSTWGYDNMSKKYQTTWRDSMMTTLTFMEGAGDGKKYELSGQCVDPMDGKTKTSRNVITITSPTSYKMEMYSPGPDGKDFMGMEITYTRSGLGGITPKGAGEAQPKGNK